MTSNKDKGGVIWITGYQAAGKTTVARKLTSLIREAGYKTVFLDGDDLRAIFGNKWGYEKAERLELAQVYLRLCSHLSSQGIVVVLAAVAMYNEIFEWFERNIPNSAIVHLDVPEEELLKRDKYRKGIFAATGKLVPGYDRPQNAALRLQNFGTIGPDEAANKIFEGLSIFQFDRAADYGRAEHWRNYYLKDNAPQEPSSFARFVAADHLRSPLRLLDVGCGNGRDAAFFSSLGHDVIAIDEAETAIDLCQRIHAGKSIRFVHATASSLFQQGAAFDAVYCRFVLHAMTLAEEQKFISASAGMLPRGGRLFIECRSVNDPMLRRGDVISPDERLHGHYRRFIEADELRRRLVDQSFEISYAVESAGLASYRDDDPVVIRIAATKS